MATPKHCSPFPYHVAAISLLLVQSLATVSSLLLVKDHRRPILTKANHSSCDLFMGSWVRDDSYPIYQPSSCRIIDPEFDCQLHGRPDTDYLKYRWQPAGCQIPRFSGAEFMMKMRGKSVMFVGDSLGRNQWQSFICMMISTGLPPSSPTQIITGDPLSIFKFLEYGLTVSFYRAPYLVDIVSLQGRRVLKLDDIGGNADHAWRGVDVLSFDTGHWWTHEGSLQGWDYMQADGTLYHDMDRLMALERALRTWAKWVDTNIDTTRSRVFFQGFSPTHYKDHFPHIGKDGSGRGTLQPGRGPWKFGEKKKKKGEKVGTGLRAAAPDFWAAAQHAEGRGTHYLGRGALGMFLGAEMQLYSGPRPPFSGPRPPRSTWPDVF
ncbi:hypothetical protein OROMI_006970 [Orobanche minor]